MKTAPGGLVTWLPANNVAYRADLITLTLIDGSTKYRWTTADVSLTVGGFTWLTAGASAPLVQRGPFSQSARLSIDTLDITLVGGGYTINGKTLGQLAREQYFRGARLQLDHLIGADIASALGFGPITSFFEGRVATVEPSGTAVVLRVKSELVALNVSLPKFLLQPACGNVVYDATCSLNRASFTLTGAASGTPTTKTVPTTTAGITAKAAGYFDLGVIQFTSGTNNGLRRAIQSWASNTFTLALALPAAPAAGDTFSVYPGCDRKRATCLNRFNNLAHYRGFPHIPAPEAGA